MPASNAGGSVVENVITDQEYWQRVRKLAHDLRSPLSVICTGLQAMESVRNDEATFNMLLEMMQAAGSELKDVIETLAPSYTGSDCPNSDGSPTVQ